MNSTNTSPVLDTRLERLLGGAGLAPLRIRMRRHFERVDNGVTREILRLANLSAAEHEALCQLIGRRPRRSQSMQIDVRQLDAILLDAGIASSLRNALELIDGPIVNRAALRASTLEQWHNVITSVHLHATLTGWVQTPAAVPLLKRLSGQDPAIALNLLECANVVLHRLPADGVPLSQIAAETLGNAHALDNREPVATVTLAAWRHMESRQENLSPAEESGEQNDLQQPEERVREIWARAGVLVNELARPVLFMNLPVSNQESVIAIPGEPHYLSLRRLLRTPPIWDVNGVTVFLCENPNLVAIAADRLSEACAPLICTDGMPAAAQRTLLTQLEHSGALLMYHGDFDWPGLQIGNYVMRTWKVRPWRFGAAEYEASVANVPFARHDLTGTCVAASWDVDLMLAMQRYGIATAEEAVAGSLLEDLRQNP